MKMRIRFFLFAVGVSLLAMRGAGAEARAQATGTAPPSPAATAPIQFRIGLYAPPPVFLKPIERIYFETGASENGPLAYMTDWANNDARTEGMSYGMMIAVELNKKREFDALWNWSHTYMLITDPKNPSVGY